MANQRSILVGCDGSEGSQRATAFAADFAAKTGDRLVLACVDDASEAAKTKGTEAVLQAEADRMRYLGTQVECRKLSGNPAEALASCADDDEDIRLLVVGKRGQGGLKHGLMGGVASRLARLCGKPVVLIP
jgi:nucleotide-binding universal stress UspA family protein